MKIEQPQPAQGIKKLIFSPIFAFLLFAVFMFILFRRVPLMPGDDQIFSQMHLNFGILDYVITRYVTWSGRLFSDGMNYYFSGELYFLWKWFCTAVIVASSFAIYKWVTWGKEMSQSRKILLAYLCCFGFGIISTDILSSTVFWVTGASYYLVPFALAVIAFTPFVFTLKNLEYKTRPWLMAASVFCAAFAVLSQEQAAVSLLAASVVTYIYLFIKTKKLNWFLLLLIGVTVAATIFVMRAPGNQLRYEGNLGTFPLFNMLNFQQRLSITTHFSMNTLINQSYMPLMFLWFVSGWMLFKEKTKKHLKILGIISIVFSIIIFVRMINPLDSNVFGFYMQNFQQLFSFSYLDVQSFSNPVQMLPYIVWGPALLLIPINIWLLWGKSERSFIYTMIFIAAIGSLLLITMSPTMYFSGARTGYVTNMLFLILLYFMLTHLEKPTKLLLLIILIGVVKLVFLYSLWNATGFTLWYGVLDTSSIPFKVMK